MSSVAKRLRKKTQPDQDGSRHSDAHLLQKIDTKFADLKESLTSFLEFQPISENYNKLSQLVAKLENEVREMGTLKHRVAKLKKKLEDNQHDRRVEGLEAKLVATCTAQGEAEVACDLRWLDVPQVEGEKLRAFFHALCFSLELTPPPKIRSIFQMRPRLSAQSIVDSIIIVKMNHVRDKAMLLREVGTYRRNNKTQLSLKLIGLDSPAFIYLNEQLAKPNYKIFKRAMHLQPIRRLSAVFQRRGEIFVKKREEEDAMCVQSLGALDQLEIEYWSFTK